MAETKQTKAPEVQTNAPDFHLMVIEILAWAAGLATLLFLLRVPLLEGASTFRHDNIMWGYPIFQFFADHVAHDRLPFWNPYSHGGEPFYMPLSHTQNYQPLRLLITWMGSHWTSDGLLLFNWNRVLQNLVMVFGAYLTLRRFCNSWMARVSLVPVLLFSSTMLGSFQQDARADQFLWAPYVAYFLISIVYFGRDHWREWLLLSAVLGLNYFTYFFVGIWLFVGFFLLGFTLFQRDLLTAVIRRPHFLRKLGVLLAVQLTMMAPVWALWRSSSDLTFPARTIAAVGEPTRAVLDYATLTKTGAFSRPMDFAAMLWPSRGDLPAAQWADWGGTSSEAFLYLGLWPWALGLLGLCVGSHELKRVWAFTTGAFFLLMLGPAGGLRLILFYIFPVFRIVRHTHIYACFFEFGFLYFYVLGLNRALDDLRT